MFVVGSLMFLSGFLATLGASIPLCCVPTPVGWRINIFFQVIALILSVVLFFLACVDLSTPNLPQAIINYLIIFVISTVLSISTTWPFIIMSKNMIANFQINPDLDFTTEQHQPALPPRRQSVTLSYPQTVQVPIVVDSQYVQVMDANHPETNPSDAITVSADYQGYATGGQNGAPRWKEAVAVAVPVVMSSNYSNDNVRFDPYATNSGNPPPRRHSTAMAGHQYHNATSDHHQPPRRGSSVGVDQSPTGRPQRPPRGPRSTMTSPVDNQPLMITDGSDSNNNSNNYNNNNYNYDNNNNNNNDNNNNNNTDDPSNQ